MTIIESVKTFIATYSELDANAPLDVNNLDVRPIGYSIIPLPGTKIVEEFIDGETERAFPFGFQSVNSTADEIERLVSIGWFEAFSAWLEAQTLAGVLPSLGTGKESISIEALNMGYLTEQGESNTGIYQVECLLTYGQVAP